MEIVKCKNCEEGVIAWDKDTEKFICNKCGALYE